MKIHSFKVFMSEKFPRFWLKVRQLKWRIILPIRRIKALIRAKKSDLHADPHKVYWIPTDMIKKSIYRQLEGVPNTALAYGTIKGGNWDLDTLPIEKETIFISAKNRFVDGVKWQKTKHYTDTLDRIFYGEMVFGCKNKEDLEIYFKKFDQLYETIKKHGYKTQRELLEGDGKNYVDDEISVHIDRVGHYIFSNGAHRLSIALILGLKIIPVMVCIRHAEWQSFVNEILAYAKINDGHVYQPFIHPDLKDIPSAHGGKRFEIIKKHLSHNKGTLLDIGSHWGYFCHLFEDLGFDCYAVESAHEHLYFLKKLKIAGYKNFKIIEQSILDFDEINFFNVVLALNIFHHFLKTEEMYHKLISFLNRTNMNMMFFEPHIFEETQMENAYRNYKPDEFVQFILANSCLKHSEIIGKAEDGRVMYKLWQ
ncbi:MAG TPA: class I SAM-dependent methyltransferase [Paludibacteraceae bacterium]|nr:class I SAM-dependent methyltransferase [Paludibacteraceae bacterium]